MSETALMTCCYHCHAPLGDAGLRVSIGGVAHAFCCAGCQGAFEKIHALALDDYYDYRERFEQAEPARTPADPGARQQSCCNADAEEKQTRRFDFENSITGLARGARISLRVPDIRCAACTWLIESSVRQRDDVIRVRTNLAERLVTIDYENSDPMDLVTFVEGLGFTVLPDRATAAKQAIVAERKSMLARLGVAGIGMMQVMMYAFATYVAGDTGIEPAYEALMRWASLAVAIPIVLYSAMPFHKGALRDLRHLHPGMDVPVSLAISAAFVLSTWNTIFGGREVYFDSVAMFTFLLLIGRFVELGSRQKYQQSQLLSDSLLPASALLQDSGQRIPIRNVVAGDIVRVAPGESVPVDGVIVAGTTSVIEAAFTGESKALEKTVGSRVLAGSDNTDGTISVEASASYDAFVITRISNLYRESASYKPRFSILADQVARYFVLAILAIATASGAAWYLKGAPDWFAIALSVLVVSCPCALSLATPVAYTVATAALRVKGVVISHGELLERLARITRIVFDKTGTLTRGNYHVTAVKLLSDIGRDQVLAITAALEAVSRHPIANAFEVPSDINVQHAEVIPGEGVTGEIDGVTYRVGKPRFAAGTDIDAPTTSGSWIMLASHVPIAFIRLDDELRDEAPAVVSALRRDFDISLYTGDSEAPAVAIGAALGLQDVAFGLSPEQKLDRIRRCQARGESILMIGDGINDTAAMAAADAAIAVSPRDLVVQEAADATLLNNDLASIERALVFARKVRRVIRQNIGWAVGYNLMVIPLAVTGMIAPWMAALGMSLSSVLVVLNANRLQVMD